MESGLPQGGRTAADVHRRQTQKDAQRDLRTRGPDSVLDEHVVSMALNARLLKTKDWIASITDFF